MFALVNPLDTSARLSYHRPMTTNDQYRVEEVSLGDGGLTQRPVVYGPEGFVRPFRRTERHLADALAARLNRGEPSRKPYGLKRDRNRYGWWTHDARLFLERGAPMTDGGTAWQVWVRVLDSETEHEGYYHGYKASATTPLRRFRPLDGNEVQPFVKAAAWYAHLADAGSLAEARETGEKILVNRLDKATDPA